MAITAREIRDQKSLKQWLEDQPNEVAQAIAARVALRVLPIVLAEHWGEGSRLSVTQKLDLTSTCFRATFTSWVARKYPTHDVSLFADAAAAVAFAAVRADGEWVEARTGDGPQMGKALIEQPLWLSPSNEPDEYRDLQARMRKQLQEFRDLCQTDPALEHFGVIADWYSALLPESGQPRSLFGETLDLKLVTQPEKFWDGDAKEVMKRVAKLVGWPERYRQDQRDDSEAGPQENQLVEIPQMKSAAIMPEWQRGRLVLPGQPVESDFAGGDIDQALSALKKELQEFAGELESEDSNVDKRVVQYIAGLAKQAPESVPTQEEFFRFAHKEEVLRGLIDTAQEEWGVVLAARFGGLVLTFSQTVQKFPPWREFTRAPEAEVQTPEQLEEAQKLEEWLSGELRDELDEFVATEIPDALDALVYEIPEVLPMQEYDRTLPESVRQQGRDILESISNTLKNIVVAALQHWGREVVETVKEFDREFWKQIKKEARKAGKKAAKWLAKVIGKGFKWLALPSCAVGAAHTFGWLEKIWPLLEKLIQ